MAKVVKKKAISERYKINTWHPLLSCCATAAYQTFTKLRGRCKGGYRQEALAYFLRSFGNAVGDSPQSQTDLLLRAKPVTFRHGI